MAVVDSPGASSYDRFDRFSQLSWDVIRVSLPSSKHCPECHHTIRADSLCSGTAVYEAIGGNAMTCDCPRHLGQANLDDHAPGCSQRKAKYEDI